MLHTEDQIGLDTPATSTTAIALRTKLYMTLLLVLVPHAVRTCILITRSTPSLAFVSKVSSQRQVVDV